MSNHEKIDSVEFPSRNLGATKSFFKKALRWEFTDYGPEYTSFTNQGIHGGFYKSNKKRLRKTAVHSLFFTVRI